MKMSAGSIVGFSISPVRHLSLLFVIGVRRNSSISGYILYVQNSAGFSMGLRVLSKLKVLPLQMPGVVNGLQISNDFWPKGFLHLDGDVTIM